MKGWSKRKKKKSIEREEESRTGRERSRGQRLIEESRGVDEVGDVILRHQCLNVI